MGLGRFGGGADSAEFASGFARKVIITDLQNEDKFQTALQTLRKIPNIDFHFAGHEYSDFQWADIIIVNPAVPEENEYLKFATEQNKLITSQVEIFFQLCPAKIIGITGSNGKSTTTALTAHLLKSAQVEQLGNSKVFLSGNIGEKPLLAILSKIKPDDIIVLELSSFQLQQLGRVKASPHIAVLTNLTPNHLDRHGTFKNYCDAKENIFRYQKKLSGKLPVSVFCKEDKIARSWYEKYKKDKNRVCLKYSAENVAQEFRKAFPLTGTANLCNLAAAVSISKHFNITDATIKKSLPSFKTLRHRLEFVREINGVKWYNDSISTTPESTIAAIKAFSCSKILIAGGYDKRLSFTEMAKQISENCKALILIGATAVKIKTEIEKLSSKTIIKTAPSLKKAVQIADELSEPQDTVLLSPGCASYDMFENFQQRGLEFEKSVSQIPLRRRI